MFRQIIEQERFIRPLKDDGGAGLSEKSIENELTELQFGLFAAAGADLGVEDQTGEGRVVAHLC